MRYEYDTTTEREDALTREVLRDNQDRASRTEPLPARTNTQYVVDLMDTKLDTLRIMQDKMIKSTKSTLIMEDVQKVPLEKLDQIKQYVKDVLSGAK